MTPRTLRRKLQKKKKHKEYRKCPACGGRTVCRIVYDGDRPRLLQRCWDSPRAVGRDGCGFERELFWSGGGKADTHATPDDGGRRKA